MTRTTKKTLPTLAVATAASGIALEQGGGRWQEAMEAIMGHPVWTHEFSAMLPKVRERVQAQFPAMPLDITSENFREKTTELLAMFGPTVEVECGSDERTASPIETLHQVISDARSKKDQANG
jgi:hypothetical protein